ncbi:SapC family protein [Thalassotalea litorea]|uniref:SapC family protein n=1 Tax=Thalassotalea litorea TaxID=2020715 RepID=A0A5R9IQT8_9GAMM|nr:SapC family protein [Thalassotalea litorea]TLU66843.1 SapC family protein [Thalassotalea litorea]
MAKHELVNNVDHKDLKINTNRCTELGDNLWYTLTFPDEFRAVQAYYPIFFQKEGETGQFAPVALFGFQHQENLFLNNDGWDAGYIPITVARSPFTIGTQTQDVDGKPQQQRVLTLDVEHPRVNKDEGQSLFMEFGGNSDYLDSVAAMMEAIHHGIEANKEFAACLSELELLEPFTLDVELYDGSKHQMVGLYAINEEKLDQLPDEKMAGLVKSGYLKAIHFAMASQGNIGQLLARKNKQLGLKRK